MKTITTKTIKLDFNEVRVILKDHIIKNCEMYNLTELQAKQISLDFNVSEIQTTTRYPENIECNARLIIENGTEVKNECGNNRPSA